MKAHLHTCLLALPLSAWTQGTLEAPVIAETGPHHRVLQWATTERDQAGNEVIIPHQVTELATGLNWLNPLTGQWEESVEAFELAPGGYAVARRGQHKLILAPNVNEAGAVDCELPDGQRLRSNPRGLSFFDIASGKSLLLAQVKDCAGELAASNVVVFPDAFDNLKAALRYTYSKAGLEQDVILYEDPGSPTDYGLDPATTRFEIHTEFYQPPMPARTRQVLADGSEDERLEFGTMAIGQGTAYVLGQALESAEVGKVWQRLEERDFLIESVPYRRVRTLLDRAGLAKEAGEADAEYDTPTRSALYPGDGRRSEVARLMIVDPLRNQVSVEQYDCKNHQWLTLPEDNYDFPLFQLAEQ